MRIKLAVLEKDTNYLNRIVSVFNQKYSDKVQIYSFTDVELAYQNISNIRIDVLIVNSNIEIDFNKIPERCGFAYFVDSLDIESINNKPTICKYQKIDLIYKQILSIYSDNVNNAMKLKISGESCESFLFFSPEGGSGASTLAMATAIRLASKGKKVLYLNFEKLGSSDLFFSSDGNFDMSDIIFTLKSRKSNIAMKMESYVKQDATGVSFYSAPKQALDMLELSYNEMKHLISEIRLMGSYDFIIVDIDFNMSLEFFKFMDNFQNIIITGTGSRTSNSKIFRFYNAVTLLEKNENVSILTRMSIMYNKFSSKTGKIINEMDIKNIGGIPKFEHADDNQVVDRISKMSVIDNIF